MTHAQYVQLLITSLEDKLLGHKSLGADVLVAVFNCMLKGLCHKNISVLNQFCADSWSAEDYYYY